MIVFDELRITNDGEYLIIDARVRSEDLYKDVHITKVVVGNHRKYTEGDSIGKEIDFTNLTLSKDDPTRHIFLRLSILDLANKFYDDTEDNIDLKKDLIYIYIDTTPLDNRDCPNLPCDLMQTHNIGVTMYMAPFYNEFMNNMNSLLCTSCDNQIPQNLIDLILRYTALTTAIDSKHFVKANELFSKWFSTNCTFVLNSNCGCNG